MNNAVCPKNYVECEKRQTYQAYNNRRKKELFSARTKPSYKKNVFLQFISNKNEKNTSTMNKQVYLGLAILEITKIVMYEFCHNYVKPKYEEKAKSCYIATGSLIIYIRKEEIYVDIVKDVCSKRL